MAIDTGYVNKPSPTKDDFIQTALALGKSATAAHKSLLETFQLKDGDKAEIEKTAKALGLTAEEAKQATPKALQAIAQQQFQDQNMLMNLLSTVLDKIDQVRQRIIGNIGR